MSRTVEKTLSWTEQLEGSFGWHRQTQQQALVQILAVKWAAFRKSSFGLLAKVEPHSRLPEQKGTHFNPAHWCSSNLYRRLLWVEVKLITGTVARTNKHEAQKHRQRSCKSAEFLRAE